LINLNKNPIDRLELAEHTQLVKELRVELSSGNMLNMEDLLTKGGTAEIAQKIDNLLSILAGVTQKIIYSPSCSDWLMLLITTLQYRQIINVNST
jgi:hypothetical protein